MLLPLEGFLAMTNIHEQCLLRYLTHPDELSYSTEILEKKFVVKNILANVAMLNYTKNVD